MSGISTESVTAHALSHYWVKILVWMIPVIFGAGGLFVSLNQSRADVAEMKKDIVQVKQEIGDHAKQGVGHSVTKSRLRRIEKGQEKILTRQQISVENIAAICQATGAKCK